MVTDAMIEENQDQAERDLECQQSLIWWKENISNITEAYRAQAIFGCHEDCRGNCDVCPFGNS